VIPPHSEVQVHVQFMVQYGGHVDELLVCSIDDIGVPLGFVVTAESFGLNVAFETSIPKNCPS